jgi:hypothetical protein
MLSPETPIPGLAPHLQQGHIVWFGEMHGTEESPRFVGDVVCEAARLGRVQLGLEIPDAEQSNLDRYVRGAGLDADRNALIEGAFWGWHDGRGSHAMVALLELVRVSRIAGAAIEVVAYDAAGAADGEEAMADAVVKARDAGAIFVGLSGNVHSRRIKGTSWDPELVPTVAHLVARGLSVMTFNVSSRGGTMWAIMGTRDQEPRCGVHPLSDHGDDAPVWTIGLSGDDAHDGKYYVGRATASHPARPR